MSGSRDRLATIITPLLPEAWRGRIQKYTVNNIGVLAAPAVFIDYTEIDHEGMPQGTLVDGFEVSLISNLTDFSKAEDELDAAVRAFVRALDPSPDISWSKASKRKISDYLGWIIPVQLLTPSTEE